MPFLQAPGLGLECLWAIILPAWGPLAFELCYLECFGGSYDSSMSLLFLVPFSPVVASCGFVLALDHQNLWAGRCLPFENHFVERLMGWSLYEGLNLLTTGMVLGTQVEVFPGQ